MGKNQNETDTPEFVKDMNFVMYDVLRMNQSECKSQEHFIEKAKNRVTNQRNYLTYILQYYKLGSYLQKTWMVLN